MGWSKLGKAFPFLVYSAVAVLSLLLLISFLPIPVDKTEDGSRAGVYPGSGGLSLSDDSKLSDLLESSGDVNKGFDSSEGTGATKKPPVQKSSKGISLSPFGAEKSGSSPRSRSGRVEPRHDIVDPLLADKGGDEEVEVIIKLADVPDVQNSLFSTASEVSEKQQLEADSLELKNLGAEVGGVYSIGNLIVAKVKAKDLLELTTAGSVEKIFANREVYAVLDESVPQISAQTFWNAGFTGEGIKVAILDTGMDSGHPMVSGKIIAEKVFTGEASANDFKGHGTHVAGIAAGTDSSGGLYRGVAPEALLMNAKVLNDNGYGSTAGIVAGINWAVDPDGNPSTDDGADVISMSLGGSYNDPFDPMSYAIRDALEAGVLVVVASGNCGSCGACGGYVGVTTPGNSPWAFTVGAVDKSDAVACFSSGGLVEGVGIKPDVAAPGVGIKSSVPGGYSAYSGTSMATPHVAGAAALLLSKNPDFTPQQVQSILENTANDLGTRGKDASYGSGVINLDAAFNAKAIVLAKDVLSEDVVMGDAIEEKIVIQNFGSELLFVNLSYDSWIHFSGLSSNAFSIASISNVTAVYTISASELGVGSHTGRIIVNTSDASLPQKSVNIAIDVFESTAPVFSEVSFSSEAFSQEEMPVTALVTDNGQVLSVLATVSPENNSFTPITSQLEKLSGSLWKGSVRMPAVSSPELVKFSLTAIDNQGYASVFEKDVYVTNLILKIKGGDDVIQGLPLNINATFMNTNENAMDVLAEFEIIDSFGLTVFKDLDGSTIMPTGFKADFSTSWTPERFGTYFVNLTMKTPSGTVLTNSEETIVVSIPDWGEVSGVQLPESVVKGAPLTYAATFSNSGPVAYPVIAALSLIDENGKVVAVLPSEEFNAPSLGSVVLSASEEILLAAGNYTALFQVYYGNRVEQLYKPVRLVTPAVLEMKRLTIADKLAYKDTVFPLTLEIFNNGSVPVFSEFTASIFNSYGLVYSERFNGTNILPRETKNVSREIIFDDFEDGVIDSSIWVGSGWSGGTLTESGGDLYFETGSSNDKQVRTAVNIGAYDDFTLTFDIKLDYVSADKNVGFWLGNLAEGYMEAGSGHRGYYFQFHGRTSGMNIGVSYDDAGASLHDKYSPPTWSAGAWHAIKVERVSGTVNFYFDDTLIGSDSAYASLMTELYWLNGRTWKDPRSGEAANIHVDNFRVVAGSLQADILPPVEELSGVIDLSDFSVGIYDLIVSADYEGNHDEISDSFSIEDKKAPAFVNITNPAQLQTFQPLTVSVEAEDDSNVSNITLVLAKPQIGSEVFEDTLVKKTISDNQQYATFFDTGRQGIYNLEITACDVYNNCNTVSNGIEVSECSGKRLLVFNNRLEKTASKLILNNSLADCTFEFDISKGEEPPLSYVEMFDAIVWTSGSKRKGIEDAYANLLLSYASGGGKLLIEGADIAFHHRNDAFMTGVAHSVLKEDLLISFSGLNDSTQSSEVVEIKKARPHYITLRLPGVLNYYLSVPAPPDSVIPINGGEGLFEWSDGDSAIVVHEAAGPEGAGIKTVFMPFDFTGLDEAIVNDVIAKSLEWLLLESSTVDVGVSFDYNYLVEGDNGVVIELSVEGFADWSLPINVELLIDSVPVYSDNLQLEEGKTTVPLNIPLTLGKHSFDLRALSAVAEADYQNNEQSYKEYVAPSSPDIVIESVLHNYSTLSGNVRIDAVVSNAGGASSTAELSAFIDGNLIETKPASIGPGLSQAFSFETQGEVGSHVIKISAQNENDFNLSNNELGVEAHFCGKEKVLVVDANDAELYVTETPSSAKEFVEVLKDNDYCVEEWGLASQGIPSLEYASGFELIVWSAGDYFGSIIRNETESLLLNSSAQLLLEGADFALDIRDKDLLEKLIGAVLSRDILLEGTTPLLLNVNNITSNLSVSGISISEVSSAEVVDFRRIGF